VQNRFVKAHAIFADLNAIDGEAIWRLPRIAWSRMGVGPVIPSARPPSNSITIQSFKNQQKLFSRHPPFHPKVDPCWKLCCYFNGLLLILANRRSAISSRTNPQTRVKCVIKYFSSLGRYLIMFRVDRIENWVTLKR
jgi:hypothetical protein